MITSVYLRFMQVTCLYFVLSLSNDDFDHRAY